MIRPKPKRYSLSVNIGVSNKYAAAKPYNPAEAPAATDGLKINSIETDENTPLKRKTNKNRLALTFLSYSDNIPKNDKFVHKCIQLKCIKLCVTVCINHHGVKMSKLFTPKIANQSSFNSLKVPPERIKKTTIINIPKQNVA